jgi:curved DNA-binding protein CbpA
MIEDTYRKHKNLGYYGILGLEENASFAEIKQAYYRTSKEFHPDSKFQVGEGSLKNKLSDIFSYINEAYSVLSKPEKREKYNKSVHVKPAKQVSGKERARIKFKEGKLLLKNKRYSDAELVLGQAVYLDSSQAEYHYYHGISLLRQKKLSNANRSLEKAVALDPFNDDSVAGLGIVFKEMGFPTRAKTFFKKALKINPDNEIAAKGLKTI